jgi:diguanylate cyclase (GGDEF)-like protein
MDELRDSKSFPRTAALARPAPFSVTLLQRFILGVQVALLATVYFGAAKASLAFAIPPGYATAVWPPSGIALAALLLFGRPLWPGIWLGAALVNYTVNGSIFAALMIGTGNTLEALAGAALIRRSIGVPHRFEHGEDVFKFVAFAALTATIAASVALAPLSLANSLTWEALVRNWLTWWQGDVSGMVIVTPLLLAWSSRDALRWDPRFAYEGFCFLLLLLVAAIAVFGFVAAPLAPFARAFVILPFIVWAAFRFTQREVTTVTAAVCAIAVGDTMSNLAAAAPQTLNESLLLLLLFTTTLVITGLVLSAMVSERTRTMEDLRAALHNLHTQAVTDPLTRLVNRRYLAEFLPRELIRTQRAGHSLAVLMIDLDHFKRVNDTFGHDAGDLVLTQVARLLMAHIRGSDIACRHGGEEFVLVLPDTTLEGAQRRAEEIRAAVMELQLRHRGKPLGPITVSMGLALFPDHAAGPEALIRVADEALYEAKRAGRDRVIVGRAAPATEPASART